MTTLPAIHLRTGLPPWMMFPSIRSLNSFFDGGDISLNPWPNGTMVKPMSSRFCTRRKHSGQQERIFLQRPPWKQPSRRPGDSLPCGQPLRNDIVQYVICVGTTRRGVCSQVCKQADHRSDPMALQGVPPQDFIVRGHLESSRKIQPVPARFVFLLCSDCADGKRYKYCSV